LQHKIRIKITLLPKERKKNENRNLRHAEGNYFGSKQEVKISEDNDIRYKEKNKEIFTNLDFMYLK
jgi:hypothetical protein